MAVCLRRNFRCCNSLVFIGSRNQRTNCFDQKTTNTTIAFAKEVDNPECSPLTVLHNFNRFPRPPVAHDNFLRRRDVNYVFQTKHHNVNSNSDLSLNCVRLSDNKVYSARESKPNVEPEYNSGRPDADQLLRISNILVEDFSRLFIKTMRFQIYHPNMVFENNIRGTKTVGVFAYAREIALVKIIGHLKFAYVKLQILKVTQHPEDGTIKIRWRIIGVPNIKVFYSLFKIMSSSTVNEPEGWYDGFSIFYVRSDGLIHKHIVDRMIPDSNNISNVENNLATKVAFSVGITSPDFPFALSLEEALKKYPTLIEFMEPLEESKYLS